MRSSPMVTLSAVYSTPSQITVSYTLFSDGSAGNRENLLKIIRQTSMQPILAGGLFQKF